MSQFLVAKSLNRLVTLSGDYEIGHLFVEIYLVFLLNMRTDSF